MSYDRTIPISYETLLPIGNKMQYLAYDNIVFTGKKADKLITSIKGNNHFDFTSFKLEESFLGSNVLQNISKNINEGMFTLDKCLKYTNNISNCYKTLFIEYGNHSDLIVNLYMNII